MRLKPFIEDESSEAVSEILNLTGLKRNKSAKVELDEIREIFENEGAGINDIAKMTGSLIRAAEKEETKLRAGELALKVQGIFKELDEKQVPQITITVNNGGTLNFQNNLLDLVCPNV